MSVYRRASTSGTPRSRACGVGVAAIYLILVACPAPTAAFTMISDSTQYFRGDDYGAATQTGTWGSDTPGQSRRVRGSNAMYRNEELTREISTMDSRWGVSQTYSVPRGTRHITATFKWKVRRALARVRGGAPVTTDAGGPNSTELELIATSPGCQKCQVSTSATDVVEANSVLQLGVAGDALELGAFLALPPTPYSATVVVSTSSGSLPSTIELQSFFASRSRLGGVGSLFLSFDADYDYVAVQRQGG